MMSSSVRLVRHTLVAASLTLGTVSGIVAMPATPAQSNPGSQGGGQAGRPNPPRPPQKVGLDYLEGTWTFTWTGRESPITVGPRSGTTTITRQPNGTTATVAVEGKSEAKGAYKETGTLTWDNARKALTVDDHVATGAEVKGVGDWTSPVGIRLESDPITIAGTTYRVRRNYAILGPDSYSISEELSTNGGGYVRLGNGTFSRKK